MMIAGVLIVVLVLVVVVFVNYGRAGSKADPCDDDREECQ